MSFVGTKTRAGCIADGVLPDGLPVTNRIVSRTLSPSTLKRSPKTMNENQTESKPSDAEQSSGKGLDETPCSALSEIPDKEARWAVQRVIWKKGYLARLMREEAERLEACYATNHETKYADNAAKYRDAAACLKPNVEVRHR